MKNLFLGFACFIVLFSSSAMAANHCYSPEEMAAEQLLRLHSELMVITVTCKQGSTGRDLVKAYTGFTRRNTNIIQNAERTLIDHFSSSYGSDGTSRLDQLRTRLANEFGQQIADESAPSFCANRRDMVTMMYDAQSPQALEVNLKAYDDSLSYEPPCGKKNKITVASATTKKHPR
jgi:hypothetical protein